MKVAALALGIVSLTLAASAHPPFEQRPHLGRHDSDDITLTRSVPESAPTLALALISIAGFGVVTAYISGRKSAANHPPERTSMEKVSPVPPARKA